jgi:hypothetical protein
LEIIRWKFKLQWILVIFIAMIKLIDLLKEDSPFVPKGSKEEREKEYTRIIQNKIQEYIKNGMKGNLYLSNTSIDSLPYNLKVGGNLILNNCKKITKLPPDLTVEGNLDLEHTKITSLPPNLTVENDLYVYGTPLSKKYSKDEIKAMVPNVKGKIYM